MNKRPGHVEVTTEVGYCNFCNRSRNLRREEHHLGTLVRTIVTCETCHRTLSSEMGVATAPEPESEPQSEPAATPEPAATAEPAVAVEPAKPKSAPVKRAATAQKPAARKAAATAKPKTPAKTPARRTSTKKK